MCAFPENSSCAAQTPAKANGCQQRDQAIQSEHKAFSGKDGRGLEMFALKTHNVKENRSYNRKFQKEKLVARHDKRRHLGKLG